MSYTPRYRRGDRIGGRYQVHQALAGGMGEVYLCLDLKTVQPIALKTIHRRYLKYQEIHQRFEQEAYTWVSLEKHPHIVRCGLLDTLDNLPFLFLEWILGEDGRGTDLRSWLRHGALSPQRSIQLAIDVCRGLAYAHAKVRGLVHRDLKPENVLVAYGGIAKITDFGLAKLVQETDLLTPTSNPIVSGASESHHNRFGLTNVGGVVGTPAYMAPEQWRGEALDRRTDLYALGCILFEMLTGRTAFSAPTLDALRQAHLYEPLPEVGACGDAMGSASFFPELSHLEELVRWCLSREPSARPESASALLEELEALYARAFGAPWRRLPEGDILSSRDYSNRGGTFTTLGRYEEALQDHNRAIELEPNYAAGYSNRGITYYHLVRYEEALENFNHAIALDPNDAIPYSNRGLTYDGLGRYEYAIDDYGRAIAINPDYASAYYNRGITYLSLGRDLEALADFNQAIAIEPNFAAAYSNRGSAYDGLGHYEKALNDFGHAIEIDLNDADAYYNRGSTYARLGRYAEAIEDYNRAITINPGHAKTYSNRAVTYGRLGRSEQALDDHNRAIGIDPDYASAYYNRGTTYDELGRYEEAIGDYDRALGINPNDATAVSNRGNTHLKLGHFEEALRDFNRAIELNPNSTKAYSNRGATYENLGRYEEAYRDFNKAIGIDPNNLEAHYNMGVLLTNTHRPQEALSYFERAARLGSPQATQAVAQIRVRLQDGSV